MRAAPEPKQEPKWTDPSSLQFWVCCRVFETRTEDLDYDTYQSDDEDEQVVFTSVSKKC